MKRVYVDCRDTPAAGCSVAISADNEKELLEAAMEHAVKTHGFKDTPEVRSEVRKSFKLETGRSHS